MALDATWWATGYTANVWDADWSSATGYAHILGAWYAVEIRGADKVLQHTFYDAMQPDSDKGYFYAVKDSDGALLSVDNQEQSLTISYDPGIGSYLKKKNPSGGVVNYTPPFCQDDCGATDACAIIYYVNGGTTYSLYHYQPNCYYGNPAEAIGAMLRDLGLSSDYIDMTSFSDTDDAQDDYTIAPTVYFRRDVGERVADSIKRIARHSYDLIGVNMAGKICYTARHAAPDGGSGILPQYVKSVRWRYAYEHLANYAEARLGQWNYTQRIGTGSDPTSGVQFSSFEPNCESDTFGLMNTAYEDSTSQTKYGKIVVDAAEVGIMEDGVIVRRPSLHFPYFYDEDCKDAVMERLSDDDSTLRREFEIEQDFEGLAYDIGYSVGSIAVSSDLATVTLALCIRKQIDFNNLTVRSWLLEQISSGA